MAVMLIESEDPKFSFHIKKNPNAGMTIKGMRSGSLCGWYPNGDAQKYALWFRDAPTKNSFSADDQRNYLDLTQFASTYFAFNAFTTMFNSVLKLDPAQESFKHKITIPLVQLRTERTIKHLNEFLGLNLTVEKLSDGDVERMALYKVTAEYEGTFNEFIMRVYILFYLLHGDLYQSDIVWMEGMIAKVVGILKELRSEYFLWYWFKKNILVKQKFYADLEDELGANSIDGKIRMKFGDTQRQRKNFVDRFMDFTHPILDVGCGGGDYLLPYAKHLKNSDNLQLIYGVDPDEEIIAKLSHKLTDRKQINAEAVTSLDQVDLDATHDIICIEVIEHMPLEAAKDLVVTLLKRNFRRLIISTPNREFNRFYRTMEGFRHDDHHFEFDTIEFGKFMESCFEAAGFDGKITYYGVGDSVENIHMAQAVVVIKE